MNNEYVYCHGTDCHKKHTQDRIRGVQGSKVLRTKKIKVLNWYNNATMMYQYFCSQRCYDDFANANIQQIIAIAPRTEPLETPIEVHKTLHKNDYRNWTETEIIECDNIDNGS